MNRRPNWRALSAIAVALAVLLTSSELNVASAQRRVAGQEVPYAFRIRVQSVRGAAIVTGHGTAFGVNLSEFGRPRPRYLMTACHVIRDTCGNVYQSAKIEVRQSGINWLRCRVVAYDVKLDVALLECEHDIPVRPFARRDAALGSLVTMIGSPTGVPLRIVEGRVVETPRTGTSTARVEFIREGCSGGPLVARDTQRIIGLVSAGVGVGRSQEMDPHTCLYVPRSKLLSFTDRSLKLRATPPREYTPAPAPYSPPPRTNRGEPRAVGLIRIDTSGMWLP